MELTREQILKHREQILNVLNEVTVKSHQARSKKGTVFTVKQHDRAYSKLRKKLDDYERRYGSDHPKVKAMTRSLRHGTVADWERLAGEEPTKNSGHDPLRGAYAKAQGNRNAASYKTKKSRYKYPDKHTYSAMKPR